MNSRYLYCLVDAEAPGQLQAPGVGDPGGPLDIMVEQGLGVVTSLCRPEQCQINRVNMINHQRAMELAMQRFTVLPVRYGTIAEGDSAEKVEKLIRSRLLLGRRNELKRLMAEMTGHQEMSLKVLWKDLQATLQGIVQTDTEVRRLSGRLVGRSVLATRPERIHLGGLVAERMKSLRETTARQLLQPLAGRSARVVRHDPLGDRMVLNGAFLLASEARDGFDQALGELQEAHPELIFRYLGPMPPCSFVSLVISWD